MVSSPLRADSLREPATTWVPVDDLLKFLHESPLFVDADKSLLRDGLEAYEKEDFVKAIHVNVRGNAD
jgi:hypothetical protein